MLIMTSRNLQGDMQLTIFTDYGLRSLMYLAVNEGRLSNVREIAEHYDISRNHLVKVVHRLAQLKYITSSKGKGGGIRLTHRPDTLLLGELVRALEPNMDLVECFNRQTNKCRVVHGCTLKHFLADANKAFLDSLNQHTLADTVNNKGFFLKLVS